MQKRWIYFAILGIGGISLVRSTVGQGTDFLVFWKAGRALLESQPIYQVAQDGGMVFKYPPWIAPLFIPFALFSFEVAKWLWGMFCVLCMAGIFSILERKLKVKTTVWAPLAIFYWGLWVIHALDGQIILPLLFFGLWAVTANRTRAWIDAFVPLTYSAKVFTVYPIAFVLKRFSKLKVALISVLFALGLSGITAVQSFHGDAFRMFHDWKEAAASGGKFLAEGQTRGAKNQSLTSFVCRSLSIPADDTRSEVAVALVLFVIAFWVFSRRMRSMNETQKFLVGLALTPVFHPLPWHHLHLWTFPLAAYALNRRRTFLLFLSLFLITLSSERAFGWIEALRPFGHFLEWNVGRAWGALLLAWVATESE